MFAFPIIKGHTALGPGQTDRHFSMVWHSCTSCPGILVKAKAPTPKYTVHILPRPGGDMSESETWEAILFGTCNKGTVELTVPLLSLGHLWPSLESLCQRTNPCKVPPSLSRQFPGNPLQKQKPERPQAVHSQGWYLLAAFLLKASISCLRHSIPSIWP